MKAAGVVRAVVAALYCAAAFFVLADLSDRLHWSAFAVRLPLFAIIAWAYTSKWKNRLVSGLWLLSLAAMAVSCLIAVTSERGRGGAPIAEETAAAIALVALALALAVHAWRAYRGWREERARLRARYPSAIERSAGGF